MFPTFSGNGDIVVAEALSVMTGKTAVGGWVALFLGCPPLPSPSLSDTRLVPQQSTSAVPAGLPACRGRGYLQEAIHTWAECDQAGHGLGGGRCDTVPGQRGCRD